MKHPFSLVILTVSILAGWAGWVGLNALLDPAPEMRKMVPAEGKKMAEKVPKSEKEWKETLTPDQYRVLRECGTERAFSGKYNIFFDKGTYFCAACGAPLFSSETKYDHGTGWPSFTAPLDPKNIEYRDDFSLGMMRVEVRCAACGSHLGHAFDDGPAPERTHFCINSVALDFRPAEVKSSTAEVAAFAAGCFWGVEYKFSKHPGVISTVVGYSGGQAKNPTYGAVCSDKTGHAEAVQVTFDPSQVSYEQLVRFFFEIHDPTQLNRQGPDVGTQYRSVIFYHNEEQKKAAEKVKEEFDKSGRFGKQIVTEVVRAADFYKAEDYHQGYYEKRK
jgi:peptide methionine sulfoxide reductase msrA/msrB